MKRKNLIKIIYVNLWNKVLLLKNMTADKIGHVLKWHLQTNCSCFSVIHWAAKCISSYRFYNISEVFLFMMWNKKSANVPIPSGDLSNWRGIFYILILVFAGQHKVTDPGEWRKKLSPPAGTMAEVSGGHRRPWSHLDHPNHMRKLLGNIFKKPSWY